MFVFKAPEPIVLLLEDTSGNYAGVTSVTVDAVRLLPGRDTLRGDEAVEFSMTVTSVPAGSGWLGGWKASWPIDGVRLGDYMAIATINFAGGPERSDCPFQVSA